ncbi:MAG: sensor histidine kinase [Taibaiella sp.]|nr:sensor histidine kinase [Taibaiella sp.]
MYSPEDKFYTAVAVTAVVLGLIIAYFIITMIKHHKRNVALYKARIKAEIDTQEKERKRIASDMHDELGPVISSIKLHINHLECKSDEDKELMEISNRHIDNMVNKLREISYNLLPAILVRHGLVKAVEEYIDKLGETNGLKINFDNSIGDTILTKEEEINLYRILQEIIHNTIKHSKATFLSIQFRRHQSTLYLVTADNGIGFDFNENSTKNSGLGLYNLQSRAEVLNAKFSLNAENGKGTKFVFEIPVK